MERDKENFDGWMIDYMAGRLSEEDLQQFHALLNSDVFYKKRFKELSKEYAKYLIPHFAEEEANNYEKLLHRLDLKKRSHSLASSRYFSWRNIVYYQGDCSCFAAWSNNGLLNFPMAQL